MKWIVWGVLGCSALLAALNAILTTPSNSNHFVSIKAEPNGFAWWIGSKSFPFGTTIRGLHVTKINPQWCRASEFSSDIFPDEQYFRRRSKEMAEERVTYSLSGKFDGIRDLTALVGVYESCVGSRGTFLILLENTSAKEVRPIFVNEYRKPAQWAGLHVSEKKNEISVWGCLGCDDVSTLEWNPKTNTFEWKNDD